MEDEDEITGALGAVTTGATGEGLADLLTPGLDVATARNAYAKAQGAVEQQIKANMGLLKSAQERLRAQRVGPSDAEKWFAIAAALGQPTRTGSFGETMGNLGTLLSKYSGTKREAEEGKEALLDKYGMQMGTEQLRLLQSGATGASQMLRAAAAQQAARDKAAAAAGKRRTGFNPVTGELVYMDTGEVVRAEAELPVLTPEQVAEAMAAGKRMRFRTVDGREMEI